MEDIAMFDLLYRINYYDHILEFDGVTLTGAQYEPENGCFYNVEFSSDYFIDGESKERVEVTTQFRGLRGTPNYQVDLYIDDKLIKTLMTLCTPNGDIYSEKDSQWCES